MHLINNQHPQAFLARQKTLIQIIHGKEYFIQTARTLAIKYDFTATNTTSQTKINTQRCQLLPDAVKINQIDGEKKPLKRLKRVYYI
jgi:hypothetical protein